MARAYHWVDWALLTGVSLAAGAAGILLVSTALAGWSLAVVLTGLMLVGSVPISFRLGAAKRLSIFFGLLALGDFLKRVVFLVPEQEPWSQYAVWLFPQLYYGAFVLLPWLLSRTPGAATAVRRGWPVLGFILIALANTWLAPGFSPVSRLAATVLLILPWTTALVAAAYPDALVAVSRVVVMVGILSASYAFWQFAFGPTPMELNWAFATSDFSIGATHLAWVVEGVPGFSFWRVVGFQADSFTFGMFALTALACLCILRRVRAVGPGLFALGSLIFGLAILVSLVRTVWVSWVAFLIFAWLFYRVRHFRKAALMMAIIVGMVLGAGPLADYVYSSASYLPALVDNPVFQRALTVGTLEARRGALEEFVGNLPNLWLSGYGYAASDWIGNKFGREVSLPPNFSAHNGFVEVLWYTGLPGFILFLSFVYSLFTSAGQSWAAADAAGRRVLGILVGYVVAVLVSGLGNGSAFWGYYFFFAAGMVLGFRGFSRLTVKSDAARGGSA